jgi:TPP-dependent trihydroxycyclohexane-1,2-dione (THcHDO) dehydratase
MKISILANDFKQENNVASVTFMDNSAGSLPAAWRMWKQRRNTIEYHTEFPFRIFHTCLANEAAGGDRYPANSA